MNKFESPNTEAVEEAHGIEILHECYSPEDFETFEHALRDEGYSINTIEDAFEYADNAEELEVALINYNYAKNADEKDKAFASIINFIK